MNKKKGPEGPRSYQLVGASRVVDLESGYATPPVHCSVSDLTADETTAEP